MFEMNEEHFYGSIVYRIVNREAREGVGGGVYARMHVHRHTYKCNSWVLIQNKIVRL